MIAAAIRGSAHSATTVAGDGAAAERSDVVGGRAVRSLAATVEGIDALHEASERIGAITETIDEIAGHANLLALKCGNRSGALGRARPRVRDLAEEIRRLADRAASANSEIAAVIRHVQKRTGTAVSSTREGDTAARAAHDATTAAARALEAIRTNVWRSSAPLDDVGRANEEHKGTTEALMRATTAVREQASRNRDVASGPARRRNSSRTDGIGRRRRRKRRPQARCGAVPGGRERCS